MPHLEVVLSEDIGWFRMLGTHHNVGEGGVLFTSLPQEAEEEKRGAEVPDGIWLSVAPWVLEQKSKRASERKGACASVWNF